MTQDTVLISLDALKKAYSMLEKFSDHCQTDQEKAGIVKGFEFCYELAWKVLKRSLFYQGLYPTSPRECIREAARQGIIEDPVPWLLFLDIRNRTVHTYDLKIAEVVIEIVPLFKTHIDVLICTIERNHVPSHPNQG